MNWKIAKELESLYIIRRSGEGKIGSIEQNGVIWNIHFDGASNLNGTTYSLEQAIGYVRGVERAVQVYGKEMAR